MSKRKLAGIIFLVLVLLWCAFIWSFSFKNAEQSDKQSDGAKVIVSNVVQNITERKFEPSIYLVRKLAHFAEFAALGFLLFVTLELFEIGGAFKRCVICLLASFSVAATDEIIQIFSPGRRALLLDVMLDVAGAMLAFMICMLIKAFIVIIRRNRV